MLREAIEYARDLANFYYVIATRRALKRGDSRADVPATSRSESEPTDDARLLQQGWDAVAAIHPDRMRLKVTEVIEETDTTVTLRSRRVDGQIPPFRAGQYVNVYTNVEGVETSRPYSISSAPESDHLDLTIKAVEGGFVAPHLARQLRPGDELTTSGPAGSFYYEPLIHGSDLVFIAAGSGITPFMSMIRHLDTLPDEERLRVHLLYGSRGEDVIFLDELESLSRRRDWLTVTISLTDAPSSWAGERGRVSGDLLRRILAAAHSKMFYICGPEGLATSMTRELESLGVEKHRVTRELFGGPVDVTRERNWPEEIRGDDTFEVTVVNHGTITVNAGESLLNSLERNHLALPSRCRSGQCSSCRIRVVDGPTFSLADGAGRRGDDERNNFAHACVTYPVGDLQLSLKS